MFDNNYLQDVLVLARTEIAHWAIIAALAGCAIIIIRDGWRAFGADGATFERWSLGTMVGIAVAVLLGIAAHSLAIALLVIVAFMIVGSMFWPAPKK